MTARPRRLNRSAALFPVALVALLAAANLAAASPAVAAEDDVTWGVRTAVNGNGADRDNFGYTLEPGAHVDDALIVTNHDAESINLAVYAADGFTTTSGQLDLVTPGTESVAVGSWATVAEGAVQIAPGASVEVPFTVSVPADAVPGDYAGGIVSTLSQPGAEQGITVDRRLGIRMHVRVLGELTPALAVEDLAVTYDGTVNPFGTGAAQVSYTVHNTGTTRLAAGQAVSLTGPWGLLPVPLGDLAAVPELLPGETWTVSAPVDGIVPAFWLTASGTVTPTVPSLEGAAEPVEVAPVEFEAGTWAVPWAAVVLLVLLVGGVVLGLVLGRRRRIRRAAAEDARVQTAVDRALAEQAAGAAASAPH